MSEASVAKVEPTPYHVPQWDDPELTPKVAWAMGVEAAGKEAEANGGRLDREATNSTWISWLQGRAYRGLPSIADIGDVQDLYQQFRNGWQAHAMRYFCIDDGKIEDVIEWFTERMKLDEWFAGAGE